MYRERIERIIEQKGLKKSDLATYLGVKKQNLLKAMESDNICRLKAIAKFLGVSLQDIVSDEPCIRGYVELNGESFIINSISDLDNISAQVKEAWNRKKNEVE